jgi:prophage antirepressor-like protein
MEIYYDRIRKKLDELEDLVGKPLREISEYLEYEDVFAAEKDLPTKCFDEATMDEHIFYDDEGKLHLTEHGLLELVMTSNQYKALEFQNLVRPVVRLAKEEYGVEL